MFQDATTPALEIVENLELVIQDCEMYADKITENLEQQELEGGHQETYEPPEVSHGYPFAGEADG
jgi:hypothetical protein